MKLESKDKALKAVELGEDKKAGDAVVIHLGDLSSVTEFVVILTANSEPQMNAVIDNIQKGLREESVKPLCVEGIKGSGWFVMDYGDIIIHVFTPKMRDFLDFEGLWSDGKLLEMTKTGTQ